MEEYLLSLGKAAKKLCLSEGIRQDELASDSGIALGSLQRFFDGKAVSDTIFYGVITALGNATKLGIKTPNDVITRAKEFPDITHERVNEAVSFLTSYQGMTKAEVNKNAKTLGPPRVNDGRTLRGAEFELDYYRAKALGFSSIGALLAGAKQLSKTTIDDAVLASKIKELQEARNMPHQKMADALGVSIKFYRQCLQNNHFSSVVRAKLPATFGLACLKDIVNAVNELEPLPPRKEYGEAVKTLRKHQNPPLSMLVLQLK